MFSANKVAAEEVPLELKVVKDVDPTQALTSTTSTKIESG